MGVASALFAVVALALAPAALAGVITMPAEGTIGTLPLFESTVFSTIYSVVVIQDDLYFAAATSSGGAVIGKVGPGNTYEIVAGSMYSRGSTGDDGPASAAEINIISSSFTVALTADSSNIYFVEQSSSSPLTTALNCNTNSTTAGPLVSIIRRVSLNSTVISLFAGTRVLTTSADPLVAYPSTYATARGDEGLASMAVFMDVRNIVYDRTRNILYVSEVPNGGQYRVCQNSAVVTNYILLAPRLRAISLNTGIVSTVVGTTSFAVSQLFSLNAIPSLTTLQNLGSSANGSSVYASFQSLQSTSTGLIVGTIGSVRTLSYSPISGNVTVIGVHLSSSSLSHAMYEGAFWSTAPLTGTISIIDENDNMYPSPASGTLQMISNRTSRLTIIAGTHIQNVGANPSCQQTGVSFTQCTFSIMDNVVYGALKAVTKNGTLIFYADGLLYAAQPYSSSANYTPAAFRTLPRIDIAGTLIGTSAFPNQPINHPQTETSCQIACFNAPACQGYSYNLNLRYTLFTTSNSYDEYAYVQPPGSPKFIAGTCYLYANITQFVPSSAILSGVRADL